jgi:hypothetical protein
MFERALQGTADAVHALLPLVPDPGKEGVEAGGQQSQMPLVPLGHCSRFLEFLRLVSRAREAGEVMSGIEAAARHTS